MTGRGRAWLHINPVSGLGLVFHVCRVQENEQRRELAARAKEVPWADGIKSAPYDCDYCYGPEEMVTDLYPDG